MSRLSGLLSLLVGVHQLVLHPIAVCRAWTVLYGPVRDPRLLVAFAVHDLGYWRCPNLLGVAGEAHVELGARIMTALFDPPAGRWAFQTACGVLHLGPWGLFTLLHSRFYAAHLGVCPSRLCAEVWEDLQCAREGRYTGFDPAALALPDGDPRFVRVWAAQTRVLMADWARDQAVALTPQPGGAT
ncbi:hypothetical protein [Deinococcus frigens]|uniref:hypothetical protein n=1 Tax=Deinococcus frigens TaxID=249403 RepID=UPI0006903C44|nr:hypothetical protein [Deinococcus frigens]